MIYYTVVKDGDIFALVFPNQLRFVLLEIESASDVLILLAKFLCFPHLLQPLAQFPRVFGRKSSHESIWAWRFLVEDGAQLKAAKGRQQPLRGEMLVREPSSGLQTASGNDSGR